MSIEATHFSACSLTARVLRTRAGTEKKILAPESGHQKKAGLQHTWRDYINLYANECAVYTTTIYCRKAVINGSYLTP